MEIEVGKRSGSRAYKDSLWKMFRNENGIVLCSNCGHITGAEATELDHNVPLHVGGYDVPSNIRPLCHACHMNKHLLERLSEEHANRIREGQLKSDKKNGRPRCMPENYKDLLNDYVHCRIGKKELSEKWGVQTTSRKDPSKMQPVDMVKLVEKIWYKDYLRELGIEKVDNCVDFWKNKRVPRGKIAVGEYVGTITYTDGRTEDLFKTA